MNNYKTIFPLQWGKTNRALRKRELITFSFVLVIIAFIIFLSWTTFDRMKENERKVAHTHKVLRNFDLLFLAIRDEGGFAYSYFITGETSYLQSYQDSKDSTVALFSKLENMVGDNPSQVHLLKKLRSNSERRVQILEKNVELKKTGKVIPENKFFYDNKDVMNEIRSLISQAEATENKLMKERSEQQEIFTSQSRLAIIVFSLMIISILIVSMIAILSELNKRIALEEFLKSILDASLYGIQSFHSIRDSNNKIIDFQFIQANLTSYILTKGLPDSYLGKTFLKVYPSNFKRELFPKLVKVVETGESVNFEFHFFNKNTDGWVQIAAVKLGDGLTVSFEDISKAKRTEMEAARYLKDVKRSNKELEQFAYAASHDLQEPLRKILAFIDRLKIKAAHTLDEESRNYFDRIIKSSERMKTLINDLMAYSRAGNIEAEIKPIDLNKLITEIVTEDFEMLVQQKNAVINIEPLPAIEGVEVQFRQLFQNLLSNSLKFSKNDIPPVIDVSCKYLNSLNGETQYDNQMKDLSYYRIYFSDNGIGFETEYEKKIFRIFQRLHGRNEYEGTGIGLAICKKIVSAHHGSIVAKSNFGKGATFIITLPLKQIIPNYATPLHQNN